MQRIGMGIGWVQRWFAKPLAKGSIPSHASKAKRFPADYSKDELGALVSHHHDLRIKAETKMADLRDRNIDLSRQLSAMKRGKT